MNVRNIMHPYRRRLRWEAVLKSSVWALALAAGAAFLYMLFCHMVRESISPANLIALTGAVFIVCGGLLFAFAFRPTKQQEALRIDALGLEERVSTMIAYDNSSSYIAAIQRKDTLNRLKTVPAKSLRIRIPKKGLCVCAVLMILTCSMSLLPFNILTPHVQAESETDDASLQEAIAILQAQIDSGEFSEDEMAQILANMQALSAMLCSNGEDIQTWIDESMQQAEDVEADIAQQTAMHGSFTLLLADFDLTREMADAILIGSIQGVQTAAHNLIDYFSGLPEEEERSEIERLTTGLHDMLSSAEGMDADTFLISTFNSLYMMLAKAELASLSKADMDQLISYYVQKTADLLVEAIAQSSSDAAVSPTGEGPNSGQGTAALTDIEDWYGEGAAGSSSMLYGTMNVEMTATELIYDPKANKELVPYGSVFGSYYAKMLEQLEGNEITDEMQGILMRYFDGI